VVIAGLRASAFVAILKDGLMLGAIVLVGAMAIAHWRASGPWLVSQATYDPAPLRSQVFSITTVLVQAAGFALIPQTWAFLFSASGGAAIRRAQVVSPLYLLLFPC
jgi:SSS family solute:Na+ symporter